MKKIAVFAYSALALIMVSCNSGGFKTSDSGLEYNLVTSTAEGNKAQVGDFIEMDVVYKTDKDSVLFDTKKAGKAIQVLLREPSYKGSIEEGFAMMSKGDSGIFKIIADSFFVKFLQGGLPPFITKGSKLTFNVKMNNITPKAEFEKQQQMQMQKQQVMLDSLKKTEQSTLNNYLLQNKISTKPTASGLIFITRSKGNGKTVVGKSKVTVNYEGYLLDGRLFDTNKEDVAKSNNLFDPNRPYEPMPVSLGQNGVIKGFEEGISKMQVGEKATLIIPSNIAYDATGSGPIPPYASIRFELEVLSAE